LSIVTRTLNIAAAGPDGNPEDADAIVICKDVTRIYSGESGGVLFGRGGRKRPSVRALDAVSLAVSPGEFVAVVGASGSGKSTLLHLLAGLDTPTSGAVTVAGAQTETLSERGRARLRLQHIGIVFQRFHLLPSLSARANVALPLVERGVRKRERRERATDLLERVGLAERASHRPRELSGGEQQRVAVARALVCDPALVVADEPTGELDSATGARVLDLLSAVGEDRAVVVASHDEQVVERADRVVHLRDGRRVEDG
jgi:putative ABC transport system ATP-binding protein